MIVQIAGKDGPKIIKLNRRRAIRERCLNCSAWIPKEVRQCEIIDCALYPFRMGKGHQDPVERKKAIRGYCMWCTLDQPKEIRLCPSIDCSLYAFRMGSVDRSVDIALESENDQIEGGFKPNKSKCIPPYAYPMKIEKHPPIHTKTKQYGEARKDGTIMPM